MAHGLTVRQERFCREFMVDGNLAAAARRAGYSERSAAKGQGSRLMKLPAVVEMIETLNKEIAGRRIADAEEVMAALTAIVRRETRDWVIADKRVVEVMPKLADVVKAAELLGRRYAMFRDKGEVLPAAVVLVDDICVDAT
ncbi:MAG: terminase small subunit [Oscillospiraceae bacterium]|nr:terminase small subunit [Oscillospiraceae bacterium]